MTPQDLKHLLQQSAKRQMTRRELLKHAGLLGMVGLPMLTAACGSSAGGAAKPLATTAPAHPAPTPTPPPLPTVATTAAPSAASTGAAIAGDSTISVEAYEGDNGFFFRVDQLVVPAGKVTFDFKNTSTKMNHELWVYPVQDLSGLLALQRAGQDVEESDYIQGVVGNVEDVEPGKSDSFDATLEPGFYELACFLRGKNPDGSTFVHLDKGQTVTIAATGPGGLTSSVGSPAGTMSVVMTGDPQSSWLFVPDRLEATAGQVNFKITNQMKQEHDFVVYPLEDITQFVAGRFTGEEDPDYTELAGSKVVKMNIEPGQTYEGTQELTPGMWAAACFMTSKNQDGTTIIHRDRGQRFTFLVQ